MAEQRVAFADLNTSDLVVDCVYEGGIQGHSGDDPLARLLPVGNQGGFRYKGSIKKNEVLLVALYTSGSEIDWPDQLDPTTGDFTYYGDNREPGKELHDTTRGGNQLLRHIFAASRAGPDERRSVPPVLLFEKSVGRDVTFRGLLAPGSARLTSDEELVAIWRTTEEHRFQNYRSHFTVLETPRVSRQWINEILGGEATGPSCPSEWRAWVDDRIYQPLEAPRTTTIRSKANQLPDAEDMPMLQALHKHFAADSVQFEHFAADMWVLSDPKVASVEVTRPSRDGGRDAVGEYRIGPNEDPVRLDFALEAKCFLPQRGVGVGAVSRLISRIKHREFGVFVTTSYIARQAYKEVREEDEHPIVFLTGRDLVDLVKRLGPTNPNELSAYLNAKHPVSKGVKDQPERIADRNT